MGILQQNGAMAAEEVSPEARYTNGGKPAAKRTLWQLGADAEALADLLENHYADSDGVVDDEVAAIMDEWLADNQQALADKLDGYCALIRQYEATAEARKAEVDRLRKLATTDANTAARLKARLQAFMEATGVEKCETPRFKIAIANNGGQLPMLLDEGTDWQAVAELNPDLVHFVFQPNKDAIREMLGDGAEFGFARLGERGRSLRIR